ncbi:MAG TPA: hypothetical protein VH306_09775 [Gaiellaceae bacterium]
MEGAHEVTVCGAGGLVDGAAERAELAVRSGAVAVDMESAALAESGRLVGVVRVVSDDADARLGRLARAVTSAGDVQWRSLAAAFALEPVMSARGAARGSRALRRLKGAAEALGATG